MSLQQLLNLGLKFRGLCLANRLQAYKKSEEHRVDPKLSFNHPQDPVVCRVQAHHDIKHHMESKPGLGV